MKTNTPFINIVWADQSVASTEGETGSAYSQTVQTDGACLRMIRFTPGYRANHWCSKGHVVLVLSFETTGGNSFKVEAGSEHHVYTDTGAKVFIVD